MNEFREGPRPKECKSVVGMIKGEPVLCGEQTYLEWAQYKESIPICKTHINRMRTKAQRRQKNRVSEYVD